MSKELTHDSSVSSSGEKDDSGFMGSTEFRARVQRLRETGTVTHKQNKGLMCGVDTQVSEPCPAMPWESLPADSPAGSSQPLEGELGR